MKQVYGNLMNRLEEGKNYTGREIQVGDDVTMYLWSDRHCYYVTDVIDQKRIKVRPYFVCADKEKASGMGHQDLLYFKDVKEYGEYLGHDQETIGMLNAQDREEVWVFRYNKWMSETIIRQPRHIESYTKREQDFYSKHGYIKVYSALCGKVSFGVRDYYYDWEF